MDSNLIRFQFKSDGSHFSPSFLLHPEAILDAASLSELDFEAFEAKARKVIKNAYLADQIVNDVLESREEATAAKENETATSNCEAADHSQNSSTANGEDRAALTLLSLNGGAGSSSSQVVVNGHLTPVLQVVADDNGDLVVNLDDQAELNESRNHPGDRENEDLLNNEPVGDQAGNRSGQAENGQDEEPPTKKKRTSGAWAAKQAKKKHFHYLEFFETLPPINELPNRKTRPKEFHDELNKLIDAVDPEQKHPITWEGIAVSLCHRYPELWEKNFSGCVSFILLSIFSINLLHFS